MIRAFLFDLDGTLVQTEKLKARSYANAVHELSNGGIDEESVVNLYKNYVGLTREEIASGIMEYYDLEQISIDIDTTRDWRPWEAFVSVRLKYYEEMLEDREIILDHRWPRSIQLLSLARDAGCFTALATMSHREQANKVLDILGLEEAFDSVATRDDVEHGKPNPEIYELTAARLQVEASQCIVLEDSPAGVQSALNAGMHVVAVATPFTGDALRESGLLPPDRIVADHDTLVEVVADVVGTLA